MRYYATLGYTPGVLLDLRDFVAGNPKVTIFHGDPTPQQVRAIDKAGIILGEMGLKPEWVEVRQPWNIEESLRVLFSTYRRHDSPKDIVVNASGGTEVLNSAATILGLMVPCRVRYWDRKLARARVVDYPRLLDVWRLEGTRADVVTEALARRGRVDVSDLTSALSVTPGMISRTLHELREGGLVDLGPKAEGRGKTVWVLEDLWPLVLFQNPDGTTSRRSGKKGNGQSHISSMR